MTVTEPYSLDDIRGVIDRQAGEDTWWYAMLYDLRAVTDTSAQADLQQIADRVCGYRRAPGSFSLATPGRPAAQSTADRGLIRAVEGKGLG